MRRTWLRLAALAALAFVLAGATAGGFVASGLGSVPDEALVAQPLASDTLVYDRTGQVLLADLHPPGYQHYQVPLTAMGTDLPTATVAVEDANFWHEPGVDPLSVGPMAEGTDGIYVAAPAWHQFMQGALDRMGKGDEWYQMPSDVHTQFAGGRQAYFLDGTSPSTPAPALPQLGARGRVGP
jgi:membrane carboxypeptidase/penicillin-binding protein